MSERAILSNLDFEYELAGVPTARLATYLRRWSHVLRLIKGYEDAAVVRAEDAAPVAATKIAVWGMSPRARVIAGSLADAWPSPECVRRANSKLESHAIEKRLGLALLHARRVDSLDALEDAVAQCPHDWIAKHPFGVSGRERALGRRGVVDPPTERWLSRQFADGWSLIFEPRVAITREVSLHFAIDREVTFVGWTELLTDTTGTFRGNRIGRGPIDARFLRGASAAADAVRALGYRGPLGIDAFVGTLGTKTIWRPVTEINARMSFGRLTLSLRRFVPEELDLTWWHPSRDRARELPSDLSPLPEQAYPGIYRLPRFADPDAASGTAVLVEPHRPPGRVSPSSPGGRLR